jgi:ankyrin repeat protein
VLQSAGIDIMTPDSRGSTALHRAAEGGFGEIVQGLLEMGASPLSLDKAGRTPELVARGQNQIEAMAIFQSYDAKNAIMRVINNNAANKAVNNASNTKGISRT